MTLILERLYLGGLTDAKRVAHAEGYAYLCLTPDAKQELPQLFEEKYAGRVLFKLILDEVQRAPEMKELLPECASFVGSQLSAGRKCLVFCKWGQSRSATVVIDYLMTKLGYTLRKAFWHVRGLRHIAFPNVGFFELLQEKDLELHGRMSMTESRADYLQINAKKQHKPSGHMGLILQQLMTCVARPPSKKLPPGGVCLAEHPADRGIWQVASRIFIGDEVSANNKDLVLSRRIERMLSLVPEQQGKPAWADDFNIVYKGIKMPDDCGDSEAVQVVWRQCHDFIADGKFRNTLVFCEHGHSRSSTIVISHLMIKKKYTLHHAYWSVRQRHSTCFPNAGFFEELKSLELKLSGQCTMPFEREEYESLRGQTCRVMRPHFFDAFMKNWRRVVAKPEQSVQLRKLYGPLGVELGDKISIGDLALAAGLKELPTHRCFMVAGKPQYCRDQSTDLSLDIYEISVLSPVPMDDCHQVHVAMRMITIVICPETYRIYLASEHNPEDEHQWYELKFFTSPFHGKDIDEHAMLEVIKKVQKAPCASAGEVLRRSSNRDIGTLKRHPSASEMVDHWEEMMESPFSAPVRVWQQYLWGQKAKSGEEVDEAAYTAAVDRIMPLDEGCIYDDFKDYLKSAEGMALWTRLDLRHMETRYTKPDAASLKRTHGSMTTLGSADMQDTVENFRNGQSAALLDKVLSVGRLDLLVLSYLGSGKSGAAYRARVLPNAETPIWLEDQDVVLKVARGFMRAGSEFEEEAEVMRRIPASVPHCIRYLDAGNIRPMNETTPEVFIRSVSAGLFHAEQQSPFALVSTVANGVNLSRAFKGNLSRDDRQLWFMLDQLLNFSESMEDMGAFHGDMTLDNALWDEKYMELTFIDFGNAGFTEQDPFKRVQRAGCVSMLKAIAEVLESTAEVPSAHGSCLAWLRFIQGVAETKASHPQGLRQALGKGSPTAMLLSFGDVREVSREARISDSRVAAHLTSKEATQSCRHLHQSFHERLTAKMKPAPRPPSLELEYSGSGWKQMSPQDGASFSPQERTPLLAASPTAPDVPCIPMGRSNRSLTPALKLLSPELPKSPSFGMTPQRSPELQADLPEVSPRDHPRGDLRSPRAVLAKPTPPSTLAKPTPPAQLEKSAAQARHSRQKPDLVKDGLELLKYLCWNLCSSLPCVQEPGQPIT